MSLFQALCEMCHPERSRRRSRCFGVNVSPAAGTAWSSVVVWRMGFCVPRLVPGWLRIDREAAISANPPLPVGSSRDLCGRPPTRSPPTWALRTSLRIAKKPDLCRAVLCASLEGPALVMYCTYPPRAIHAHT